MPHGESQEEGRQGQREEEVGALEFYGYSEGTTLPDAAFERRVNVPVNMAKEDGGIDNENRKMRVQDAINRGWSAPDDVELVDITRSPAESRLKTKDASLRERGRGIPSMIRRVVMGKEKLSGLNTYTVNDVNPLDNPLSGGKKSRRLRKKRKSKTKKLRKKSHKTKGNKRRKRKRTRRR